MIRVGVIATSSRSAARSAAASRCSVVSIAAASRRTSTCSAPGACSPDVEELGVPIASATTSRARCRAGPKPTRPRSTPGARRSPRRFAATASTSVWSTRGPTRIRPRATPASMRSWSASTVRRSRAASATSRGLTAHRLRVASRPDDAAARSAPLRLPPRAARRDAERRRPGALRPRPLRPRRVPCAARPAAPRISSSARSADFREKNVEQLIRAVRYLLRAQPSGVVRPGDGRGTRLRPRAALAAPAAERSASPTGCGFSDRVTTCPRCSPRSMRTC